jgi:hypothetical protein
LCPIHAHHTINQERLAYIDPLTPDEHAALERSILAEGCRDALMLWGNAAEPVQIPQFTTTKASSMRVPNSPTCKTWSPA